MQHLFRCEFPVCACVWKKVKGVRMPIEELTKTPRETTTATTTVRTKLGVAAKHNKEMIRSRIVYILRA